MACPTHPCSVPPKLCFLDLNLWNPQNPFVLHLASFRFPEKQNKKSQWGETMWPAKQESDSLSKALIINNNFWSDRISRENKKQIVRQS